MTLSHIPSLTDTTLKTQLVGKPVFHLNPFSGPSRIDVHLIETLNLIYNYYRLSQELPAVYIHQLYDALGKSRAQKTKGEWAETCKKIIWPHPLTPIIHQDPCTKHSFDKPKGYAGDATLIDYFYRLNRQDTLNDLERHLIKITINRPAGVAVNERAVYFANEIDTLAQTVTAPRVLSVACGYLREARLSRAVFESKLATFIAFDQDQECIESIRQDLTGLGVSAHQGTIVDLMKNKFDFGEFDLIYSAGLLDYLSVNLSKKLISYLFSKLRPGGSVIVTNFLPDIEDAGYMEAFMGWFLLYKSMKDMESISSIIPSEQLSRKEIFKDPHNQLIYLKLTKA